MGYCALFAECGKQRQDLADLDPERALAGSGDQHVVANVGAELAGAEDIGDDDPALLCQGGSDRTCESLATAVAENQLGASGSGWSKLG